MSQWYMSFCDASRPKGTQFLGALVLDAPTLPDAITRSHVDGLNPGGEIQVIEIPSEWGRIPASHVGRLLDRAEAEALPEPTKEAS